MSTVVIDQIIHSFYETLEEELVPEQNLSDAPIPKFQLTRASSEVSLTPNGVFKALDKMLLPREESYGSLASLASQSHNSLNSLDCLSEENVHFFKVFESFTLPSSESAGNLLNLDSSSDQSHQMNESEKWFAVKYMQFFVNTLEGFLLQVEKSDE